MLQGTPSTSTAPLGKKGAFTKWAPLGVAMASAIAHTLICSQMGMLALGLGTTFTLEPFSMRSCSTISLLLTKLRRPADCTDEAAALGMKTTKGVTMSA
eukprot:4232519-Pleurochrysis_carterae.AAC.5